MTTPLDSATPICYKREIFRQSEYIFYAFFALFIQKSAIFPFPVCLTQFPEKRDTCCPGEVDTFHQIWSWSDHPLPRYDTFTSNTLRYILTLTIDLLTLKGSRKSFVMQSNPASNLSVLRPSVVMMFTLWLLLAIQIAHWQLRMRSITWYLQGVDINHIFETIDPNLSIHFATFMALRRRLTSVIHKNSVQPMLKAEKLTVHAPYHVTYTR